MRIRILLRAAFVALIALISVGVQNAHADSGSITLTIFKGGWIIGGSAGSGTLTFRGRSYPLAVGGIDYGLVFGGSKTVLRGQVRNIQRASDVAGVYAAAGAGLAVGAGAREGPDRIEARAVGADAEHRALALESAILRGAIQRAAGQEQPGYWIGAVVAVSEVIEIREASAAGADLEDCTVRTGAAILRGAVKCGAGND